MAPSEGRSHLGIIITLGMLIGLNPFSIDMYLPGFAAIAADLRTDTATVGLTLSSFFAGICIGQVIYGPLLDRFGRKKPLLIGLGIYLFTSIAAAFAGSIEQLIVLRFVQALGGCAGMVASRAYVRDLFPPEETARVFSLLILVMGVAPVIAPSVGSFIVTTLDWHAIFVALALIAAIIFMAVLLVLPESKTPDPEISLNPPKVVREYFGVALNARFMLFTLAMSFSTAALFAYITSSPILFMKTHGLSEFQFGLTFSFCAVCLIIGSQVNRLLLRRFTTLRAAEVTGIGIALVSSLLLVLTIASLAGFLATIACIAMFLFLMGMFNPNAGAMALTSVHEKIGMASALMGFIQMGLSAIAAAIVSSSASVSAASMSIVLFGCVEIAVGCIFMVRLIGGEATAANEPDPELVHTTI
jgi:DHA1 family bicyclomycin/chloramphenicol resistance-like MFS transporter